MMQKRWPTLCVLLIILNKVDVLTAFKSDGIHITENEWINNFNRQSLGESHQFVKRTTI